MLDSSWKRRRSVTRIWWSLALVSCLGLPAGESKAGGQVAGDDQEVDVAARTALRYAEALFAGEHGILAGLQDDTMDRAMTEPAVDQARKSLEFQFGRLERLGTPWFADELQGYRRYRVPAFFARQTMDLMVVFDAEGQVAGFTVVPYVEQLDQEPLAPGRESEFSIGHGERALPGTLTLPVGEGPFAAAVIVHGSGPHDRDGTLGPNKPLRDIAWGLAERGVATLRYEKRSKHDPQSLVSLGDRFTLVDETIADAQEAVRALRLHPEIREQSVFVVGHSLGGTAVPRIGEMDPAPAGLIVLAGMTLPFADKIVTQTEYIVRSDGLFTDAERQQLESVRSVAEQIKAGLKDPASAPTGYLMGAPIGYYRDLADHPPADLAARAGTPILVLQGDRDYQVTLEDFAVWSRALEGKPFACLVRYPDLNHFFQPGEGASTPSDYQVRSSVASEMLDDVAAWIERSACPTPSP